MTQENQERDTGNETVESKLNALDNRQLLQLAQEWKAIYQQDRSPENTANYSKLRRELAKRGLKED